MAVIPIERTQALDDIIREERLNGVMFTGESSAHRFRITCTRNGAVERLRGLISARFMLMSGPSYYIEGSIDNSGAAVITLSPRCYDAPGNFRLTIYNTDGGEQTTIYAARGEVLLAETKPLIDTTGAYPTSVEAMVVMIRNLGLDVMQGATASRDGTTGTVPTPLAGDQNKYLSGAGTWKAFANATQSAAGYMSASDKKKLDGIEANANAYVHPVYTALTGKPTAAATPAFGGTFTVSQITTDSTGHVTGMTDRVITIPATLASTSGPGLMSKADKEKLDSVAANANAYSLPAATTANLGGVKLSAASVDRATYSVLDIGLENQKAYALAYYADVDRAGLFMPGEGFEQQYVSFGDDDPVAVDGQFKVRHMRGASASANGLFGAPPAPQRGDQGKFLRGDATWADPPAYTLPTADTTTTGGIKPSTDAIIESGKTASDYVNSGWFLQTCVSDGIIYAQARSWDTADASATMAMMTAAQKAKLDSFGAASTYALKSDLTAVYKYKGSKASVSALPSSGNTQGDVWDVSETGMNYAWNGSAWDALGTIYTPDIITDAAVDAICV